MVEAIDMPDGALGFHASGRLESSDYEHTIRPAVEPVLKAGGELRILFELADDFDAGDLKSIWDGLQEDADTLTGGTDSLKRSAIVTDLDSVRRKVAMFSWLAPGEAKAFRRSERSAADAWVVG